MSVSKQRLSQPLDLLRCPATSAHIPSRFRQERRTPPFIISTLHTLFAAANPQSSHYQQLVPSFTPIKNLTPTLPITSALLPRSLTNVQCSTPLLSGASAL